MHHGLRGDGRPCHQRPCSRAWTELDGVHTLVWNDPLCTFYVHLWPCRRLASTHFLWRPHVLCLGLYSSPPPPPPPPPSTCAVVLRNPLPTKWYYSIGMTSIYIQCVGVFIFLRLGTWDCGWPIPYPADSSSQCWDNHRDSGHHVYSLPETAISWPSSTANSSEQSHDPAHRGRQCGADLVWFLARFRRHRCRLAQN